MIRSIVTRSSSWFVVVALTLVVTSCKGGAQLEALKKQALDLVAQYAPQVDGLEGKVKALTDKLAALPAGVPGLDALRAKLDGVSGTLASMKATLGGAPAAVETAIQNKDAAGLTALLDTLKKDVADKLPGATTAVTEATTESAAVEKAAADAAEAAKAQAAAAAAAAAAPPAWTKALSTGFELKGAPEGLESKLVGFIEDAARAVDKTTWFDFDRLTFQTGKAELDMDASKEQLTNVAEVLKAYPKVTLKLGGYTDNSGDAAANKKLSQERADATRAALVALGVDGKRLEAEGYGVEHPACPANDSEECKAKNRRIAVRVSAK